MKRQPTNTFSPRRENRIQARRKQILEAAINIFAEKGYQTTGTREIAEVANLAEGTIYNYFENKSDILVAFFQELSGSESIEKLLHSHTNTPIHELFQVLQQIRLERNPLYIQAMLRVLPEIITYPELRQIYHDQVLAPSMKLFEAHLELRIQRGEIKPLNPVLLARILATIAMGLSFFQLMGDQALKNIHDDSHELQELISETLFHGILARNTPQNEG